jgi:uncharacterized phage-associated protein
VTYHRHKTRKLIDVVNFLLRRNGGSINYTKLVKLLYLADRAALVGWGFTITGDEYYALHHGPVLSHTLDLIKGRGVEHAQSSWDEMFYTEGYDLKGEKTARATETLSEIEEQILSEIDTRYKDKSFGEMIDIVHDPDICPEWNDPGNGSFRITLDQILSAAGLPEDEVAEVVEDLLRHEQENEYLLSKC